MNNYKLGNAQNYLLIVQLTTIAFPRYLEEMYSLKNS
jgi:hypothetical protein